MKKFALAHVPAGINPPDDFFWWTTCKHKYEAEHILRLTNAGETRVHCLPRNIRLDLMDGHTERVKPYERWFVVPEELVRPGENELGTVAL